MRWRVGGVGVGVAVGWNIATLGPIATRLAHVYGVSLTTVGLFVTVQFVVHMVMQVPGGRAADRFGARTSALAGLGLILAGNGISLFAPQPALAFLGRAVVGLGTGFAFVGGSDYIRARGGSPFLQGVYGGGSVLAPGLALALVPVLAGWEGFRAPYVSAIAVACVCILALVLAPPAAPAVRHAGAARRARSRRRLRQRLGVSRHRRRCPARRAHVLAARRGADRLRRPGLPRRARRARDAAISSRRPRPGGSMLSFGVTVLPD